MAVYVHIFFFSSLRNSENGGWEWIKYVYHISQCRRKKLEIFICAKKQNCYTHTKREKGVQFWMSLVFKRQMAEYAWLSISDKTFTNRMWQRECGTTKRLIMSRAASAEVNWSESFGSCCSKSENTDESRHFYKLVKCSGQIVSVHFGSILPNRVTDKLWNIFVFCGEIAMVFILKIRTSWWTD